MARKGSLWSTAEVECLLEIWADGGIQQQLDTTHKNSEIFKKISRYLRARGYERSVEQCREKLKKLRAQYLKVRDSSSPDDKAKFRWYDAVGKIIGKPTGEANVLESYVATPSASPADVTEDAGPASQLSSE